MILGSLRKSVILFLVIIFSHMASHSTEEIKIVPLVNLEDISPTFEEEKDELEKIEDEKTSYDEIKNETFESEQKISDKIYVNLKALDKITAKTSSIKIAIGEKKNFGKLEIKPLKCATLETKNESDIIAYLQVKDLSSKNKDQVFVFNGWTFASSPTLRPIDHPVYDLWLINCDNI